MSARTILVMATLAATVAGCGRADGKIAVEEPVIPVRTALVGVDTLAPAIEATGILGPKEQIDLGFKIGGVIARVHVDEGAEVRKAQILATLDLVEIDAQVARARSALDKAERDLARAQRLYRDSVATLEQVENATTARDIARADFETARFNQRHAVILAPAAGVVLRRVAEPGELVSAGHAVVVFGNRESGAVMRASLADRDRMKVRPGDAATLSFDAFPGRTFAGQVLRVGAAASAQTGTYTVEVAVHGVPAQVAGLIGRVRLQPSSGNATLMVPIDAITEADAGSAVVYTISSDGTTAKQHRVAIGAIDGEQVAVLSGLEGGARIVTAGAPYLVNGSRVRVVE